MPKSPHSNQPRDNQIKPTFTTALIPKQQAKTLQGSCVDGNDQDVSERDITETNGRHLGLVPNVTKQRTALPNPTDTWKNGTPNEPLRIPRLTDISTHLPFKRTF
jgi:hypothetical protein